MGSLLSSCFWLFSEPLKANGELIRYLTLVLVPFLYAALLMGFGESAHSSEKDTGTPAATAGDDSRTMGPNLLGIAYNLTTE